VSARKRKSEITKRKSYRRLRLFECKPHFHFNSSHKSNLFTLSVSLTSFLHFPKFRVSQIPMAEVMNVPPESLDKSPSAAAPPPPPPPPSQPSPAADDLPPPPPPPHYPPRRRDRRDDRDFDRPPNRRGDYYDRNASPPRDRDRDRDRDFKRRRSPSPPHRDQRYSPAPRRSPPPYKRSRRGSPRGGYGPDDR